MKHDGNIFYIDVLYFAAEVVRIGRDIISCYGGASAWPFALAGRPCVRFPESRMQAERWEGSAIILPVADRCLIRF